MTREEAIKKIKEAMPTMWKDTKEAIQTVIPELAESEDERMLREIKRYIKEQGDKPTGLPNGTVAVADMITWLEKQKECVSNNFDDVWNEEDCEEIITEGQKLTPRFKELLKEVCHAWYDRGAKLEKQEDASKAIEAVERIDKYIDENLANAHDMKDSNPDKKYYRGWDDALGEMARILQDVYSNEKQKESLRDFIDNFPYSAEQEEQKPAGETNVEPDSKIPREEYLYHLLANHIITFTDYTYLLAKKPFDYECVNIPQKDYTPVEQKSADLSEMMVHKEPYIAPVPTPMVADEQKQEWSEEDEKVVKSIINYLSYDGTQAILTEEIDEWIAWLKSLRLNLKKKNEEWRHYIWTTNLRFDFTALIKYDNTDNYEIVQAGNRPKQEKNGVYTLIKDIKPQSHWKPTEHQMTILKAVKEYVGKGSGYWGEGLGSLINDLEKL